MTRLSDVNTTDILDAIELARNAMCSIFDPEGGDVPYFRVAVLPEAYFGIPLESHVPGRHLNALLNAEDAAGLEVDEDVIQKFTNACFYSYGGPVPFPLDRSDGKYESPIVFVPHNIREGFHALNALVKYRGSRKAEEIAAASIAGVFEYWNPETEWDYELMKELGMVVQESKSFISGVARAIGPLVKYFRTTRYAPALELAIVLKEKCLDGYFTDEGSYERDLFGTHAHSVTCTMSSLAQLADLTGDSTLMSLVTKFYDNGLWEMRDETGWSREAAVVIEGRRPDEGEMNNTGDILETALILGRWGYTEYFHDAERILRCHLLPSQLRDISWIPTPDNPRRPRHPPRRRPAGTGLVGFPRAVRPRTRRAARSGEQPDAVQHRCRRGNSRVAMRSAPRGDPFRRGGPLGQSALRPRHAAHRGTVAVHSPGTRRPGQETRAALRPHPAVGGSRCDDDIGHVCHAPRNEWLPLFREAAGEPADHLRVRAGHRGGRPAPRHPRHPRPPPRRRGGCHGEPRGRPDVLRAPVDSDRSDRAVHCEARSGSVGALPI